MTEMKLKDRRRMEGWNEWHEPDLNLTHKDIMFGTYVVRINGKTYTQWSFKFSVAFEDDRLFRILANDTV